MNHSSLVKEVLDEYSGLTRSRMLAYLPEKEPKAYLYDIARDYPLRGGRGLRPSICIANAKAMGGSESAAILSAVSIELMHNALLIHDDVEDESELRRGKGTLNELHGIPVAVNVGDTLILMSFKPLMDNLEQLGSGLTFRILKETMRTSWETAEGQAMELGWRKDNVFSLNERDYLRMVAKKTAWLTIIHPLRVGALIAGKDDATLDALLKIGLFLGAAFQIQDDLLNLTGDPAKYGKELNGDIAEGKRTLMLIRLFKQATKVEKLELEKIFFKSREARVEDISRVRAMMEDHHCIEYARAVAHGMAGAALHEYEQVNEYRGSDRDAKFIEGLIHWVIERN